MNGHHLFIKAPKMKNKVTFWLIYLWHGVITTKNIDFIKNRNKTIKNVIRKTNNLSGFRGQIGSILILNWTLVILASIQEIIRSLLFYVSQKLHNLYLNVLDFEAGFWYITGGAQFFCHIPPFQQCQNCHCG